MLAKNLSLILCVMLLLLVVDPLRSFADDGAPATQMEILPPLPGQIEKWQAMRFGMFIHWGPVSISGKEIGWSRASENTDKSTHWREYDQFYKQFNPVQFDADEWVRIAKDTGMKYMVLTSKHHDGFCLWDSAYTDHDIMSSPFKRDVMQELTDACKRQGIVFGPYHSICDWYQPDYGVSHHAEPGYQLDRKPDIDKYRIYLKNQLKEMNTKYGPFAFFWFDGEWEKPWTHEYGVDLNNYCRKLQPDALINNRVDKGREGMEGTFKSGEFAGDYATPEQRVGAFNRDVPWETCMTICRQWAWKPNDKLKSLKECIQTLVYTAGDDGNLLLNVGPMPDGRIEPRQVERLKEIGEWMRKYGDTIYGAHGGPYKPGKWGASTCKDNIIYLFIMNCPDNELKFPALKCTVKSHKVRTSGDAEVEQAPDSLKITLPNGMSNETATIIALELGCPATEIEPIEVE